MWAWFRVMWLFGWTNTAESENTGLGEVTHAQRQRNKQIDWLREKVKGVAELERDRSYRVSLTVEQKVITLHIKLSDRFPFEAPVVTASPHFIHPWVDQQMVVCGSPLLKQFNPHSNLGTAIEELIEELIKNPPQFEPNIAMATQPWAFSNPSIGPYSPVGTASPYTPFSYSSSPQPLYFSQTESISTPTVVRTSSSGSSTTTTSSKDLSGIYSVPKALPGLSEKSDEQLEKYLKDEDAIVLIDRFVSRLDVIKKIQEERETVIVKEEEQAKVNLDLEPELQQNWSRLQEKHFELQACKENFDKLYQKQINLLGKFDKKHVHQKLKTLSQDADTESEITAEDFLDQKIDLSTFLGKYLQERKLYHLRAAKHEMLKFQRS